MFQGIMIILAKRSVAVLTVGLVFFGIPRKLAADVPCNSGNACNDVQITFNGCYEIRNLSSRRIRVAMGNWSFTIQRGETHRLIGPNGQCVGSIIGTNSANFDDPPEAAAPSHNQPPPPAPPQPPAAPSPPPLPSVETADGPNQTLIGFWCEREQSVSARCLVISGISSNEFSVSIAIGSGNGFVGTTSRNSATTEQLHALSLGGYPPNNMEFVAYGNYELVNPFPDCGPRINKPFLIEYNPDPNKLDPAWGSEPFIRLYGYSCDHFGLNPAKLVKKR